MILRSKKYSLLVLCAVGSAFFGCASIQPRNHFTPSIDPIIAQDFLATACMAKSPSEFGSEWLKHEAKYWEFYQAIYYGDPDLLKERTDLVKELSHRQIEFCKNTRSFLIAAPRLIEELAPRVRVLMGAEPNLPFYFSAPLQWTDGRGDRFRDRDVYVLNAWHDTFARTTGLMVTLFHELVHAAHSNLYPSQKHELSPFLLSLYREGAAVFAVQQVFPEVGIKATGLSDDQLKSARVSMKSAAKKALRLAGESSPDRKEINLFFQGGWKDPVFPPKMGYFLGNEIFHRVARSLGVQTALRISPSEFAKTARSELEKMASE